MATTRSIGWGGAQPARLIASSIAIGVFVSAACTGSAAPPPASATPQSLAGRYTVSTGTGALAIAQALTKAYTAAHPEVTFAFVDPGSVAISTQQVADGTADVAFSSRELAPSEQHGLTLLPVGLSGTAVIVNPANRVTGLSKDQLRGIFSGTLTDWSSVGGSAGHIVVVTREASKATRVTFDEYVFGPDPHYSKDAVIVPDIEAMVKKVSGDPAAIGVATLDARTLTDGSIRMVAVDGAAATKENLLNGTYRIRRPLVLVYSGASDRPAIRGFVDFVRGPEGQAITAGF